MMYLTFFISVTLLILSGLAVREERAVRLQRRLTLVTAEESSASFETAPDSPPRRRFAIAAGIWQLWKRRFHPRWSDRKTARIELRLLRAGRPFNMGPVEYRMLQITLAVMLPTVFCLYAFLLRVGTGGITLFILLGLVCSGWIPPYYLKLKTKQRNRKALRELPDVLDVLTVSLEAGLGFDAALSKIVAKSDGVLASEFRRCLEEIRLGKTRREALSGVKDRLLLDETSVLIGSILQAEKLGIGMVQVLRVQSQEVREQRRQRAEEEAMKAPIKMLFPLILFIFPSLFIVLLGPAVIQFIEAFAK